MWTSYRHGPPVDCSGDPKEFCGVASWARWLGQDRTSLHSACSACLEVAKGYHIFLMVQGSPAMVLAQYLPSFQDTSELAEHLRSDWGARTALQAEVVDQAAWHANRYLECRRFTVPRLSK